MMPRDDFFSKVSKNVRLIMIDADGVLNDGFIQITEVGHRIKTFYTHDCLAIQRAKQSGIHIDVLTYRVTEIMKKFSERWGIEGVHGVENHKSQTLKEISLRVDVPTENILYIGDDIDDIPCMSLAGYSACPSTAVSEVKELCGFVSSKPGGRGAIREIIENLLTARGEWS